MDRVRKRFEGEAREFDQTILKLTPYTEMIDALVSAIPFNQSELIKVIDLGCGTGTLAKEIKEKYPRAEVVCLDFAENMIAMAKDKLRDYEGITYMVRDLRNFDFKSKYHAVVSSLVLHHLPTAEDKKFLYKRIYDTLREGGVFYNADIILGSNIHLQEVYLKKWKEFMRRNVASDEIENKWIPRHREEDRPAKLVEQLKWLESIGFTDVDVVWKSHIFAVYGGTK